jgi:UDP-GlcNAc:undecaprenyl-phosphate/decaprenyl-phosphate GlcNAc-1-phosphate transferase
LTVLRRVLSAGVAAVAAQATYRSITGGASAQSWERTNHRGDTVSLAEGPAVAVGSLAGLVVASGGVGRVAGVVGVAGASALGALDDLTGATDVKGLRGHLGALRQGQVTTGTLKLFGLAATGLVAGALARRGRGGVVDAVLAGGVVAGSANLANLFDLRPGRASKVFLASSVPSVLVSSSYPGSFGDLVAGPCGAAAALLGEDLGERSMLGDTGANAIGAAWGVGAASSMSRGALATTLATVVALTVASEKVSFSALIERTPALRHLDDLGRRRP